MLSRSNRMLSMKPTNSGESKPTRERGNKSSRRRVKSKNAEETRFALDRCKTQKFTSSSRGMVIVLRVAIGSLAFVFSLFNR
jgi:hypothetical protein